MTAATSRPAHPTSPVGTLDGRCARGGAAPRCARSCARTSSPSAAGWAGTSGASLGAVELIVALHRVFHSPQDALVFDVGHQAYAHKLLTGPARAHGHAAAGGRHRPVPRSPREPARRVRRRARLHRGVRGARACSGQAPAAGSKGHAVAVVGDGALTGGLTFEGLNNAGGSRAAAGGGAQRQPDVHLRQRGRHPRAAAHPRGPRLLRGAGLHATWGRWTGTTCGALVRGAARGAGRSSRPVVVHALTQKGKGFPPAEADAQTRGHAMGPYEWRDGKLVRSRGGQRTFSEAFAARARGARWRGTRGWWRSRPRCWRARRWSA